MLESKTCLSAIMSAVSLLIDTMNCKIYLFIHSYINEYHQLAWPPVKSRKHCEICSVSCCCIQPITDEWCGNLKPVSLWPSRRQKHRPDWLSPCSAMSVCSPLSASLWTFILCSAFSVWTPVRGKRYCQLTAVVSSLCRCERWQLPVTYWQKKRSLNEMIQVRPCDLRLPPVNIAGWLCECELVRLLLLLMQQN